MLFNVPWEINLDPRLLILYINSVSVAFLNYKSLLFACNLKIYKSIMSVNDALLMQEIWIGYFSGNRLINLILIY